MRCAYFYSQSSDEAPAKACLEPHGMEIPKVQNSPQFLHQFPRLRGALSGEVIPTGTPCPMDDAEAVNEPRRVLRMADFDNYRMGADRPVSLGKGGNVIAFRAPIVVDEDDLPNVIPFPRKPDTPPTPSAPASAMPAYRHAA